VFVAKLPVISSLAALHPPDAADEVLAGLGKGPRGRLEPPEVAVAKYPGVTNRMLEREEQVPPVPKN
jgi:hypothetical protein